MFKKLTIKTKILILLILSLSFLATVLTMFSTVYAKEALLKQRYNMLCSARDSKINQVGTFFNERIGDINVLSRSSNVKEMVYDFEQASMQISIDKKDKFPLNKQLIQSIIKKHDPFFINYMKDYGYFDLFLVNEYGQVVYTAAKEEDFGENLITGSLNNSGLAESFKKAKELKRSVFIDMKPYAPSNGEPAMFLSTPVENSSYILVFQISEDAIAKIMHFRKGYGNSQEDYLVGPDMLLRSDSYLKPEEYSLEASFAQNKKIDTDASNGALKGKTNIDIIADYNGNSVLSAYAPVAIGKDFNWALISEIDESEVLETPNNIRNFIILISFIILVIVLVIAVILVNKVVVNRLINFQNGLMSFFHYLNREINSVSELKDDNMDEIGTMSQIVNENIMKTKKGIDEDAVIIKETIAVLREIEQGDLSKRIKSRVSNPVLNQLKDALNNMGENLENNTNNILVVLEKFTNYNYLSKVDISGVKNHLEQLAVGVNSLGNSITEMLIDNKKSGLIVDNSSEILLSNVDVLNRSSTEAAASLEETAAALEQITANISATTEKISQMTGFAKEVTQSAHYGQELANKTTEAMEEINEKVKAITESITVIDQIAFQTNILSLNAAVEAATAGESGKGFAVVAQEVRNLASRSAEAAKEIKELVEDANIKANEGKLIADEMIGGYNFLNSNISKTIELISDVSIASKEQAEGISQINYAVNSLDQQTQQNAEVANKTKDIALNTSSLAKTIVYKADEKEFVGKNDINL